MFKFVVRVYGAIRLRIIAPPFLLFTFCCGAANTIVWYFGLPDDLSPRIFLSVLAALMPASELLSPPRPWSARGEILWFALFLSLVLLLAAGDKFNIVVLGTNAALALLSLPLAWLIWQLAGRQWLLSTAFGFAVAVMMVYWTTAIVQSSGDGSLTPLLLLLLPLPTVLLFGAIWAPVARRTLTAARRRRLRRISGPGMQALTMVILFLPVLMVVVIVPPMLGLSEIWSAASLTLVGVLLSAVVSDPLRRFLLEWAIL